MRAAKIENGIVTELWEVPNIDCYGTEVRLVDASATAQVGWTYNDTDGFSAPTITPEDLAKAKAIKAAKIGRERNEAVIANVIVHGRPWQADATSQQLLASAILLAQVGAYTPTEWRDADNNNMPITGLAQLVAIAGAIAYQTGVAYASSWARKAMLESAATIEEVGSI